MSPTVTALAALFTDEEAEGLRLGGVRGISRDAGIKILRARSVDAVGRTLDAPPSSTDVRSAVDLVRGKPGVQRGARRATADPAPAAPDDDAFEAVDDVGYNGIEWVVDGDYLYDGEVDEYEVYLNAAGSKLMIPGQAIRDLRDLYCAEKKTQNEVANFLGLPRSYVVELLRLFGITKDALPFTDEEVVSQSVEQLEHQALTKKKRVVQAKIERRDRREIERDAEKWRAQELAARALADELLKNAPVLSAAELAVLPAAPPPTRDRRATVVGNIQDSHLGKAAQIGELDLEAYSDAIVREFAAGLDDAAALYGIEEVVLTLGGDTSDTDTARGTTTSGRPMLSSVPPERAHYEAIRQGMRLVTEALGRAPRVHLYFVPGNHDRLTGWIVACAVAVAFQNDPRVSFNWSWHHRQYHRYGDHLFMLTHEVSGDVARYVGETFMAEAGDLLAGSKHRHVYTGHLHHQVVEEDKQGVVRRQSPAPIPNDEYHVWQWPNARRQIQLVLHEPDSVTERVFTQDVGRHYLASPTVHATALPALPLAA